MLKATIFVLLLFFIHNGCFLNGKRVNNFINQTGVCHTERVGPVIET